MLLVYPPDRGPGETASTEAVTSVHVAKHVQQRQEGAFQLELDTVTSVDDADSEEEETGDHTSILHELGSEGTARAVKMSLPFLRWVLMTCLWIWTLSVGT